MMVDLECGVLECGVLEYWSIGVLEYWSIGVLEYWSTGVTLHAPYDFQYSNTPSSQRSRQVKDCASLNRC